MMEFSQVSALTVGGSAVEKITANGETLWGKKTASYTNLLPLAVEADGVTPYVGDSGEAGYKTGYRINSSRAEVAASGYCCTGFIPVGAEDVVRIRNIQKSTGGAGYVLFYQADLATAAGTAYESALYNTLSGSDYTFTPGSLTTVNQPAWMRIATGTMSASTIITVNEEIG